MVGLGQATSRPFSSILKSGWDENVATISLLCKANLTSLIQMKMKKHALKVSTHHN